MEEDFILTESKKADTSNKSFLLTTVALLTSLIVLSLGVIALLLMDRQDKLVAVLATPTLVPTAYQETILTATIATTVSRPATATSTSTATITPTIAGNKGAHYIVIYVYSAPSKEMTITPTAGGALQIVTYPDTIDTRKIIIIPYSSEN
jgi:hypothetical protein